MSFQHANVQFIMDDINTTCNAYSSPTLPTISYNIMNKDSIMYLKNKDLTDSSNRIAANNIMASNGGIIAITGTPSAGQVLTAVDSTNANWQSSGGSQGKNLYVDVNASAGGDGSAGSPFNTIQEAINLVPNNTTSSWNINIANGAYASASLKQKVNLIGNASVQISTVTLSSTEGNGPINISGIYIGQLVLDSSSWETSATVILKNCEVYDFLGNSGSTLSTYTFYSCIISQMDPRSGIFILYDCTMSTVDNTALGSITTFRAFGGSITDLSLSVHPDGNAEFKECIVTYGNISGSGNISYDNNVHIQSDTSTTQTFSDYPGLNIIKDSISVGNNNLVENSSLANTNCIVMGNNYLTPGVNNMFGMSNGGTYDTANTYYFDNEVHYLHANTLGSLASGVNLVYDSTTKKIGYASSSGSKKTNIMDINEMRSEMYDVILKLGLKKFTWTNTSKDDIGLIAEEVHEVCPALVETDDAGVHRGLSHTRFTPYLIACIQELTKKNDILARQLSEAKTTNDRLISMIDKLDERLEYLENR